MTSRLITEILQEEIDFLKELAESRRERIIELLVKLEGVSPVKGRFSAVAKLDEWLRETGAVSWHSELSAIVQEAFEAGRASTSGGSSCDL